MNMGFVDFLMFILAEGNPTTGIFNCKSQNNFKSDPQGSILVDIYYIC